MTRSRSALLSMITVCCVGILAILLLVRPGGAPEGAAPSAIQDVRQRDTASQPARLEVDPILEHTEGNPPDRIEAVSLEPQDSWLSRLIELQSLPEGSLTEITSKHDAIQAVLSEPRPKKTPIRLQPGVDWKAQRRAENPELACVVDDLFRLKKAIREKRYAEYLSAQDHSASGRYR